MDHAADRAAPAAAPGSSRCSCAASKPWRWAIGQMPKPTFRDETDYRFIKGVGIEMAYGIGKMFKKHPKSGTRLSSSGVWRRASFASAHSRLTGNGKETDNGYLSQQHRARSRLRLRWQRAVASAVGSIRPAGGNPCTASRSVDCRRERSSWLSPPTWKPRSGRKHADFQCRHDSRRCRDCGRNCADGGKLQTVPIAALVMPLAADTDIWANIAGTARTGDAYVT